MSSGTAVLEDSEAIRHVSPFADSKADTLHYHRGHWRYTVACRRKCRDQILLQQLLRGEKICCEYYYA